MCYISTETLDGERNLKPKLAPQMTQGKLSNLEEKNAIKISYIPPDKGIYNFKGQMKHQEKASDLELKNFIPRGAVIRNTEEVFVVVLYTGVDTKLVLNEGKYKFKISKYYSVLNRYMIINLATLIILDLFMT